MLRMTPLILLAIFGWSPTCGTHLRSKANDERSAAVALASEETRAKGAIKEIVTLLEEMLKKSKETQEAEREVFAKYKCYCRANKDEKEAAIAELDKEVKMLQSQIGELESQNGQLSLEVAQLEADINTNEEAQTEANATRLKEADAFVLELAALQAGSEQVQEAIATLTAVALSAQHTGHARFMAGHVPSPASLTKMKAHMKQALMAADSLLKPEQKRKIRSFLQADAGAMESPEIQAILTAIQDTITATVESAQAAEDAMIAAHAEYIGTKLAELADLTTSRNAKNSQMSANDDELAAKQTSVGAAEQSQTDAQAFLDVLLPECKTKEEEYDQRSMYRAQEEMAITKAIALLDSDAAFATFGKVAATSTGATSFFQVASTPKAASRVAMAQMLLKAGRGRRGSKAGRVAGMLRAGNPFATVLAEIDKMLSLITEEAAMDADQKAWCEKERTENDANHGTKVTEIDGLNTEITDADLLINDPATGFKAQIAEKEQALVTNGEAQATEKKTRHDEHLLFEQDVGNMVVSKELLTKAIAVLEQFYAAAAANAGTLLETKKRQDPSPPSTWEGGGSVAQSEESKQVITMLQFVLSETETEEGNARTEEETAQSTFETTMTTLEGEASDLQGGIATLQEQLATTEKTLEEKKADLEKTETEKAAIEKYLEQIAPGCDFIADNFDAREQARTDESAALSSAVTLIKATPAYTAAAAAPAPAP